MANEKLVVHTLNVVNIIKSSCYGQVQLFQINE